MREISKPSNTNIKDAFVKAFILSATNNDLVHMTIGNIHMYIVSTLSISDLIKLYYHKRNMKNKIRNGLVKGYQR